MPIYSYILLPQKLIISIIARATKESILCNLLAGESAPPPQPPPPPVSAGGGIPSMGGDPGNGHLMGGSGWGWAGPGAPPPPAPGWGQQAPPPPPPGWGSAPPPPPGAPPPPPPPGQEGTGDTKVMVYYLCIIEGYVRKRLCVLLGN